MLILIYIILKNCNFFEFFVKFGIMKYKKIPKNYIKVCVDRLTRFKPVYDRYERVFKDILNKFLISDSKGIVMESLSIGELCSMVSEIFNSSIPYEYDSFLSDVILEEEQNIFKLEEDELKFLNAGLNLTGAIKYLSDETLLPLNLDRLKACIASRNIDTFSLRKKHSFLYPVSKVVLTEGATEEILLSKFASYLGYDFNKEGVFVLGAGGKNQVARKYYKMIDTIKLPVFILLDSDALETRELILTKLRVQDKIHLIKAGEFEDILPLDLIINAINSNFSNNLHCSMADFDSNLKMTKNLHNLFKNKGFGEYKKADFAKMVKNYLENIIVMEHRNGSVFGKNVQDMIISLEIKEIMNEIEKI